MKGRMRTLPRRTARPWRLGAAAVSLALLALGGTACRPLYLPPIPAREEAPVWPALDDASSLVVDAGRLTLHVVLARVPEPGWLAVQWFAPDGGEAASDSVWVEPSDAATGRTFVLPQGATVAQGEWRAVVSLRGRILRQFHVEVGAGG